MKHIDKHLKYIENNEKMKNILNTLKTMNKWQTSWNNIEEHEKYWQTS